MARSKNRINGLYCNKLLPKGKPCMLRIYATAKALTEKVLVRNTRAVSPRMTHSCSEVFPTSLPPQVLCKK
jgi:hypothetical protein